MYTYIDEENMAKYLYEDMLKIWNHSWERAGWEPKILTLKDVMRHPLYRKFHERIEEKQIKHLPRHSYMRNLAMATTPKGGFYSDIYVFPLHQVKDEDLDEAGNFKLPNSGGLTFYDGVGGAIISGNLDAWDKVNLYLVDNIEKNAYFSLQKLAKNELHYERKNMVENIFGPYNIDICEKAAGKFVIRLHSVDIKMMKLKETPRVYLKNVMIANWIRYYQAKCWGKE